MEQSFSHLLSLHVGFYRNMRVMERFCIVWAISIWYQAQWATREPLVQKGSLFDHMLGIKTLCVSLRACSVWVPQIHVVSRWRGRTLLHRAATITTKVIFILKTDHRFLHLEINLMLLTV